MTERKAILNIGFVKLIADVSVALVLEEQLSKLTQITTHYIDPDDHPDVEPNGLVLCATDTPVSIDVELVSKREKFVDDPEWYSGFLAQSKENEA